MNQLKKDTITNLSHNDIPAGFFEFPSITKGNVIIVGTCNASVAAAILLRQEGFKVTLISDETDIDTQFKNQLSKEDFLRLFKVIENDIEIKFNLKVGDKITLQDLETYDFQIIVAESNSCDENIFLEEKWFKVIKEQRPLNRFSHLNMYFIDKSTNISYIKNVCQTIINNYEEINRIKNDLKGKKIVLGGSFNPPTIAHREIAMYVLRHISNDLVLLPNGNNYPTKELLSFEDRLELIKMNFPNVDIDEYEKDLHFGGTIKYLELRKHPFFVIGTDSLKDLTGWIDGENLIKNNKFIVFKRENDDIEKIFDNDPVLKSHKENFYILSISISCVSSSSFRATFNKNYLIDEVYDIIIKNNYYK